jgi:hypothetical protein
MLQHWARADAAMTGTSEADAPRAESESPGAVGVLSPSNAALPDTADPNRDVLLPEDFHENYPGEFFQTAAVAASWEDMTTARPVDDLFSALLYNELITWPYGAVVFSNRYTRAGVAITLEKWENAGTGIVSVYAGPFIDQNLVTNETDAQNQQLLPAGADAQNLDPDDTESPQVHIYGVLFSDQNDDLIYSPGEEVAQHKVSVYELTQFPLSGSDENSTFVKSVVTDNAGHFSLSLSPGRQWVFEAEKEEQTARRIIHIEKDHFVKMFFSPPYPLPSSFL